MFRYPHEPSNRDVAMFLAKHARKGPLTFRQRLVFLEAMGMLVKPEEQARILAVWAFDRDPKPTETTTDA